MTGWLARLSAFLKAAYEAPYRRTMAREARARDDAFMMLVFGEALGVPNPAAPYTLELMPVLHEEFHDWHLRMGMDHSPLEHVKCC
ncbi:DNA helicase [Glycocaulis profundi]|nr:DNA helicase [Glycocaulis profundi]